MPTFTPSCAQRRLLDFIHENPADQSILGLCKAVHIHRATYYRWCRNPDFRVWIGIAWSSRLLMDGVALINQARAQAPTKFSYWRALAELTFDPKGLGTLAKWGESLVHLSPDAFLPGPNPTSPPKPSEPTDPPPSDGELIVHYPPRIPVDEWNRQVYAKYYPDKTPPPPFNSEAGATGSPAQPNPSATARLLSRHLRTLRTSSHNRRRHATVSHSQSDTHKTPPATLCPPANQLNPQSITHTPAPAAAAKSVSFRAPTVAPAVPSRPSRTPRSPVSELKLKLTPHSPQHTPQDTTPSVASAPKPATPPSLELPAVLPRPSIPRYASSRAGATGSPALRPSGVGDRALRRSRSGCPRFIMRRDTGGKA